MIALYLFPVFVVLLATLSFMAGGVVAVWQWWVAFALAVGIGFLRRPRREALKEVGLLVGALGVVYLLARVTISSGGRDEIWCHFPAVKLLANGWNPLVVRTPEAFESTLGFGVGDMRSLHVIFQPKAVWIFNAVAGLFTGDFLCPMLPILVFLFPATVLEIWHGLKSNALGRILVVIALYAIVPKLSYSVDATVALSAVGLLMAMWTAVKGREIRPISLIVFTFWLCAAKGAGLVQSAAYWGVFAGVLVVQRLPWRRALCGLAVSLVMVSFMYYSPFVTSAIDYGHPLYPNKTVDAAKFPTIDLLDYYLYEWNDGTVKNGYLGSFVYAYVSPTLSNAYYAWKTGQPEFQAKRAVNRQYPTECQDQVFAVDPSVRIVFWFCIGVLLAWGATAGRMVAGMIVLSLLLMPYPLFGYLRYTPQFLAPILFVLVLAWDDTHQALRYGLMSVACVSLCVLHPYNLARQLLDTSVCIRERAAIEWLMHEGRSNLPSELFYPTKYARAFVSLYFPERDGLASAWVHDFPVGQRSYRRYQAMVRAPGGLFRYKGESVFLEYEKITRIYPPDGVFEKALYVVKSFLVVMPRLAISFGGGHECIDEYSSKL